MTLDNTPRKWPELRDNECTLKEAIAAMLIMGTVLGGLALAMQATHVHEYKMSDRDLQREELMRWQGDRY